MDANKYLTSVLSSQDLKEDSKELEDLRAERDRVKNILFAAFAKELPSIRHAGSYAKGTLNKESYDLDMTSYFGQDSAVAGDTLAKIFESVNKALSPHYLIQPKNSALRLMSKDQVYFHIDVVPGRFVDDSKTDVFLHQNSETKERLKTNLDAHVDFIKGSGLVPAIRLSKLWKCRRALRVKQFVFELLVIDPLRGKKNNDLDAQLLAFWKRLVEESDPIVLEDPANPYGNDLSSLLTDSTWAELRADAERTLNQIENSGWETIFGPVETEQNGARRPERLHQAAAVITNPTRPWSSYE